MSDVIPLRPAQDRAAIATLAETVEAMAGLMRDMAILMDARDKAAADTITSLTGRMIALESRLARMERATAPRPFSAD